MKLITEITFGLLLVSNSAWAGGTGDTGGETGESGEESSSESGDFPCGNCSTAATMLPTIASPADGATVSSPFAVQSEATPECYCDDCGCGDHPVIAQRILVDGVVQGGECEDAACTFEISAAAGTHEVTLEAEYTYESVRTSITVTVEPGAGEEGSGEEGAADTGDSGGEGPGDTGSSPGPDDGDDVAKRGCTIDPAGPAPGGALAFGVLLLALRRRRS